MKTVHRSILRNILIDIYVTLFVGYVDNVIVSKSCIDNRTSRHRPISRYRCHL